MPTTDHRVLLLLLLAACSASGKPGPGGDMARASDGSAAPGDGGRDGGAPPDMTGLSSFAGLQTAKASPSAVQLSWFSVSDAETTADRMGYLVYQATTSGGQDLSTPTYTTPLGVFRYTVPRLQPGTTYYFIVRTRNASGKIDQNRVERSARTPDVADVQAPAFAGAAMTEPLLSSGVNLTWSPAVDDHAPEGELVYLVYQSATPGGQDLLAPSYETGPGASSYFVGGLSPTTTYYFVVRTRDLAGNTDTNRSEVSGTTKAVSFAAEIMPVILASCQGAFCHSGGRPQESLDLSTPARSYMELVNVRSQRCGALSLVKPGAPDMSYLISKLVGSGTCFVGSRMPLGVMPVPAADLTRIRSWIAGGAPNN